MEYSIDDYLKYYGTLSFEEARFNDVDNVLLSVITYANMDFIFEKEKKVTLKEAADLYFKKYTDSQINDNILSVRKGIHLLRKMSKCDRYKNLELYNYVYILNDETQFGALMIKISNNLTYVSFKGTDNYVIGWKEDFQMSYIFPVPAQKLAIKYLNENIKSDTRKIIVGGHSKGGNLALIASMYAKSSVKKKIIKVYSNDGLGLREQEFNSKEYKNILPKFKHIIPRESLVGLLLHHDDNYIVVDSLARGLFQHDATSWLCYGGYFIKADLNKATKKREDSLQKWLQNYDQSEKEKIVESLYLIFKKCEIVDLKELRKFKLDEIFKIIKSLKNIDDETRKVLFKTIKELFMLFRNKY